MFRRLQSAKPEIVKQVLWRIAVYGRNIAGAERLAKILTRPQQPAQIRAGGNSSALVLLLAEGRQREAYAEGAKLARRYPWSQDVGLIPYQMLGFAVSDTSAVRRLRMRFDAWNPPPTSESELPSNPFMVMGPQYKLYAAGLLSVALGETEKARDYARRLDQLERVPSALDLSRLFSVVVQASAERKDGHSVQALSLLENWKCGVPIELGGVFGIESYYGWLRAELLRETGRIEEAVHWYDTRADLFTGELIYVAPAAFRTAEIQEQTGHIADALSRYRTFIRTWENADADLQHFVAHARARVKALEGSRILHRRNLSAN